MAGNVAQWVSDWHSYSYYRSSPPSNPQGPDSGTLKVLRGGSWNLFYFAVRTAMRDPGDPSISDYLTGFRCSHPVFSSATTAVSLTPSVPSATFAPMGSPTPTETLGAGSLNSPKDGMVLIYVSAGNFLMGSADADPNANTDEQPQHAVYLDAFWIDQTDVTNAMYAKCVQSGSCQQPSENSSYSRSSYYGNSEFDNYPVIWVSWHDATTYCKWAGRRLPTEAEWEKAARGTDGRIYPWGNGAPNSNLLNYNNNVGDTTEVGSFVNGASPYGVLDMAGNVEQWVNDLYFASYYQSSPSMNPQGPDSGTYPVMRGGSGITAMWTSVSPLVIMPDHGSPPTPSVFVVPLQFPS